jgi:hypothetical protein
MFCFNKKKKPDYVKIGAIIVSAALSAVIVAFVVYKLCCKYAAQLAAAKVAVLDKIATVKAKLIKEKGCCCCEEIEEIEELENLEAAECDVCVEAAEVEEVTEA